MRVRVPVLGKLQVRILDLLPAGAPLQTEDTPRIICPARELVTVARGSTTNQSPGLSSQRAPSRITPVWAPAESGQQTQARLGLL
jgi:hypothetical protein